MKTIYHYLLDKMDWISDGFKCAMLIIIVIFTFLSFITGLINGAESGHCSFNSRLGTVNLPYRAGCWLSEDVK